MSDEIAIDTKGKRSWPKELKRQIAAESDAEGVTVCEVATKLIWLAINNADSV